MAVVSNNALADWTRIGGNDIATNYVNLSTIRKSGDIVKMWSLDEWGAAQITFDGRTYISSKTQEESKQTVTIINTSQKMGQGEVVFSGTFTGNWSPIVPDSLSEFK